MQQTITTPDEIITITTTVCREKRIVSFGDIVQSVDVDTWPDAPWENCDGWEHELRSVPIYGVDAGHFSNARGYVVVDRQPYVVTIDDSDAKDWVATQGASKQVIAECIAEAKRRTIEQLVNWYANGWEWYVASAEYRDYSDSVCGIDEYSYAEQSAVDCAREVARQMEADGFIVEDIPPVVS